MATNVERTVCRGTEARIIVKEFTLFVYGNSCTVITSFSASFSLSLSVYSHPQGRMVWQEIYRETIETEDKIGGTE